MFFTKNYFINTTSGLDCIPILHDVRFAIRDSGFSEGLVNITFPHHEASLLMSKEEPTQLKSKTEYLKQIYLPSISLPFRNKELLLDPRQMLYVIDVSAEGKRREFWVQVLGDPPTPAQKTPAQPPGGRPKK